MGSLTLSVARAGAPAISYAVTLADGDVDRLAAAYAKSYFPEGVLVSAAVAAVEGVAAVAAQPAVAAVLTDDGTIITPEIPAIAAVAAIAAQPAQPEVYRPPTGEEIVAAIAGGLVAGMLANVLSVERAAATAAAQAGVAPIAVTAG